MLRQCLMVVVMSLLVACGDDDSAADAQPAPDVVEEDIPRVDVGSDSGQICDETCISNERCCTVEDANMCIDIRNNAENCGSCGNVCAEGKGDRCEFGVCVCGNIAQGCAGNRGSTCCPPRRPGGTRYCANFEQDSMDCGGCGDECNPLQADRCEGGACRCGDSRDQCAGTPEATCCQPTVGDIGCYDLTSDRLHCGGCNNPCMGDERCEDGICTLGASTCAECGRGEICCDGGCCLREFCQDGMCM